ncbi:unnamed protein product [Rotaria magnacalcarata]|uniref:Uncharacterized protein n=4 Tax=Rotaria magnacalcarata TaxID=392030 RepID=A0A816AR01_9BILA|nr:unnamed protein product [Rotaria magnacalcarata]CAF4361395.1 unnamed protein product [Rotaria magnacalcarata]
MGQYLSNINSCIVDRTNKNELVLNANSIVSGNGKENITLFLSMKQVADTLITNQTLSCEISLINQIQNHLVVLTKAKEINNVDTEVNEILTKNGLMLIIDHCQKSLERVKLIYNMQQQQQLQKSLRRKLSDHYDIAVPPVADQNATADVTTTFIQNVKRSQQVNEYERFSYLTIHSLASLLLGSFKISGQIDPSMSSQLISFVDQLCEQLPIKCVLSFQSPMKRHHLMLQSLEPLINHISELSLSSDSVTATQVTRILLKLLIAQASFKDLVTIISKLIFDTTDVYNLGDLFLQLNDWLEKALSQYEQHNYHEGEKMNTEAQKATDKGSLISLDCLKLNGIFPNERLSELHGGMFTGEFVAPILLA